MMINKTEKLFSPNADCKTVRAPGAKKY